MTTAERLIRNLCDAARERLAAEKTEAKAVIEREVPFKDLSLTVRQALIAFQLARRKMDAAGAIIESAGYETPRYATEDVRQTGLQQPHKIRRAAEQTILPTFTPRYQKIADLQNAAAVAVMNLRGAEAQRVVETLRRDLVKV